MSDKAHWDRVYAGKSVEQLSWFQPHASRSLALIEASELGHEAAIIDVGGGTSTLAADLLRGGYSNLWVLDISPAALASARADLGPDASRIRWIESDVVKAALPPAYFDLWHDRAVFHFLVDPEERAAYVRAACAAVKPGGNLIIATFAEDGPEQCSGLPVVRYDARSLHEQFSDACELLYSEKEVHKTPAGKRQSFRYCVLRHNAT